MVLWCSETPHSNYAGDRTQCPSDKFGLIRCAQFVCYLPRYLRDEQVLAKKRALWAFDIGRVKGMPIPGASLSHYAHRCIPCGPGHMANPKDPMNKKHWKTAPSELTTEQAALL